MQCSKDLTYSGGRNNNITLVSLSTMENIYIQLEKLIRGISQHVYPSEFGLDTELARGVCRCVEPLLTVLTTACEVGESTVALVPDKVWERGAQKILNGA